MPEHGRRPGLLSTICGLRPDPRATNAAIAVETVAQYYENFGQNWERAAMIKARHVASDLAAGAALLGLSDFI